MALPGLDRSFWKGRRVLLTGHTGFKGAWAALWLHRLGAEVTGAALAPEAPSFFDLARVGELVDSRIVDLRDAGAVAKLSAAQPELVLHMAAQPLVKRSLADPIETFDTNVQGTVHLLNALRGVEGLKAVLVITSDKVYANSEHGRAFREGDALGGKDPYSASKAACEIAVGAMYKSYFAPRGIPVATARGGNVVGGGDFAADRLVPDAVRAHNAGRPLVLRHPNATRPWQHVLDCLSGYFAFLARLGAHDKLPSSLNFGPAPGHDVNVGALADAILKGLGSTTGWKHEPEPGSVEMQALAIDSTLSRETLRWRDRLTGDALVRATADWYRAWAKGQDMRAFSLDQIKAYEEMP